jgi:hypothetical protein
MPLKYGAFFGGNQMEIPEPLNSIQSLVDNFHETKKMSKRFHIGPSCAGDPCDRSIWLDFRWVESQKFPGRVLRIFRRGQNEEAVVISDLTNIGIDVRETGQMQRNIHFVGHVYGSCDGVIVSGLPQAPTKKHILEIKTTNQKGHDALVKDGVEKAKPEHYIQMQCYMHGTQIDRALYVSVNKNDDNLYTERVKYDKEIAEKAINRLNRITLESSMPAPLSNDKTWYQCKMCNHHNFCHESKKIEPSAVSCRTCAHSTAKEDGTWHCARWDSTIEKEYQDKGCRSHVIHPDLVLWKLEDGPDEWNATYNEKVNGDKGYESAVLLAGAELVADIFGAEYVKS